MPDPGRNETEAIARRAYEIWEAEGRPHGRDREHWETAARELGSPAPAPDDYRDADQLPGLAAATKKPAPRPKKAIAEEASAPEPKPARKRRTDNATSKV